MSVLHLILMNQQIITNYGQIEGSWVMHTQQWRTRDSSIMGRIQTANITIKVIPYAFYKPWFTNVKLCLCYYIYCLWAYEQNSRKKKRNGLFQKWGEGLSGLAGTDFRLPSTQVAPKVKTRVQIQLCSLPTRASSGHVISLWKPQFLHLCTEDVNMVWISDSVCKASGQCQVYNKQRLSSRAIFHPWHLLLPVYVH